MTSLLTPFEFVLNAALASDPETQAKLTDFDQRCIVIEISDMNQRICANVTENKIALSAQSDSDADLTITAKASALLKLGQDPDNLFSSDITIHGDVQFAKQLRDLLDSFDFDWEAQIAQITGDTLAYPIAHGLRQAGTWLKRTHQSLQQTTAEYLREESRLLPDQSEINDYLADIDKLRADSDRIEARIQRLKAKSQ